MFQLTKKQRYNFSVLDLFLSRVVLLFINSEGMVLITRRDILITNSVLLLYIVSNWEEQSFFLYETEPLFYLKRGSKLVFMPFGFKKGGVRGIKKGEARASPNKCTIYQSFILIFFTNILHSAAKSKRFAEKVFLCNSP